MDALEEQNYLVPLSYLDDVTVINSRFAKRSRENKIKMQVQNNQGKKQQPSNLINRLAGFGMQKHVYPSHLIQQMVHLSLA